MNKFDTYVEQNRLDLVRGMMVFEDCVFSRSQTEKILSNEVVPNLDYKLVCGVRNVNRAWYWVCSPKEYGVSTLEELHSIVSEDVIRVPWLEGTFRDEIVGVRISSYTYVPPLTTRAEAYNEFERSCLTFFMSLRGINLLNTRLRFA